ncbi:MAG: ferrochelatase [Gammaproteobacteria bacterium]
MNIKQGLLLLNLGTPDGPDLLSVCRYLRTFLMDKRVVELPYFIRWPLVHGIILPFRSPNTTKLYQKVWQSKGSPLLVNTKALKDALVRQLDGRCEVEFGMRYGNPSIPAACQNLLDQGCEGITILPLFPQYSSAATGSALAEVFKFFKQVENIPSLRVINQFYDQNFYINALSEHISDCLEGQTPEFLLFSYHGLPAKFRNYQKQCEKTSDLIAQQLNLNPMQYGTSFQSRLGRIEWIRPYTDEYLSVLVEKGVKNLTITCPSFVSDCLETLEEINIGIRERWVELGGHSFEYLPCLNANPRWVEAILSVC